MPVKARAAEPTPDIKVTASSDKNIYLEGENIIVTANVIDGTTPVDNGVVVFIANGNEYRLTTINGSCSVSLYLPAGSYIIKACYEKDGNEYKDEVEVTIKELPTPPEPKPVEVYYAPLVADLKANEEGVIEWKSGDSLPLEAVKLLVEKPELSLEFTFTYEGEEHTIFIPAGAFEKYYDVTIPWYGPAWLLQYFEKPQETEKDVIEYIIVKDDTLNALAEKYKCTVEEILALNPYINDKHLIFPNNKLLIPVQK